MSDELLELQIERIRGKITTVEREVHDLERQCNAVREELSDFEKRYNDLIKPLQQQIDAVKQAIDSLRDLQMQQELGRKIRLEQLWRNYGGEQTQHADPNDIPDLSEFESAHKPGDGTTIKSLYRRLARRYHPDLAKDDDERQRRNKIMAMINTAYQEEDLTLLESLDDTTPEDKTMPVNSTVSLAVLMLQKLQTEYADLCIQLRDLKEEYSDLKNGSLMSLKIEESFARARGEDLLQSLADDLQAEYWELMNEMQELRQQVDD